MLKAIYGKITHKPPKKVTKTAFSSKSAKKCKNPLTKGDIHDIIIKLSDESEERKEKVEINVLREKKEF